MLGILQSYQRNSEPIENINAKVIYLLSAAPDLLKDFKRFLLVPVVQALFRARHSRLENERHEKVEPQASVDDERRKDRRFKRKRDNWTNDEDEVLTHTAKAAKRIPNLEPHEGDNGNVLNALWV